MKRVYDDNGAATSAVGVEELGKYLGTVQVTLTRKVNEPLYAKKGGVNKTYGQAIDAMLERMVALDPETLITDIALELDEDAAYKLRADLQNGTYGR